jgi:hypothetical protein
MSPTGTLLGIAGAAAAASLIAARILLRLAPGPVVRWAATRRAGTAPTRIARACAHAVAGVGTRRRASCLDQALALIILFAAIGRPGRLIIGVASPAPDLRAHAWVDCGGAAILGAEQAADYHAFQVVAPACQP